MNGPSRSESQWPELTPAEVQEVFDALYLQYPFYGQMFGHAEAVLHRVGLQPNHMWLEDDEAFYIEFQRGLRDLTLIFPLDDEPSTALGYCSLEDEFEDFPLTDIRAIQHYLVG